VDCNIVRIGERNCEEIENGTEIEEANRERERKVFRERERQGFLERENSEKGKTRMGPYPYRSVNTFVNLFLSFCFYSLSTSLSTDEIINISETLRVKLYKFSI
jgi:hypothetical protein